MKPLEKTIPILENAFIFYKDNGEAVAYIIDENEQDLNGKLRSLCLQILRISFF